jgi:CRP-like cAMP-binding protein
MTHREFGQPPPARVIGAEADHVLVKNLDSIGSLSPEEIGALLGIIGASRQVLRNHDIVKAGSSPDSVTLILSGFSCRYKLLPDGGRQIHSFHIPGDVPDLPSFVIGFTDHAVGALSTCEVAIIRHHELRKLSEAFPNLALVLWRNTMIDFAIMCEWLSGIGRRDARTRTAHLICEQYYLKRAVGMANNHVLPFPVTQAELGDALGLSTVHVNRTMKGLAREKLISYRNHSIAILDWEKLQTAGQFDASYLRWSDGNSRR